MNKKFKFKLAVIITTVIAVIFFTFLFSNHMVLFNSKGTIGAAQHSLIIISVLLMAIIIVPVIFMSVYFPYKYRHSNKEADYAPKWEHSTKIELIVWLVPCLIILALGWITFKTSYSLDPRKEIISEKDPITIQVVAMNWKWLFIYPEHGIATVNEITFPTDTPVRFLVTSDTTMNSFFIPQLGSQVYAMAGMENRLNLMATENGTYRGISANYSGLGFTNMRFEAHATSEADFNEWVNIVKSSPDYLDSNEYQLLITNEREQITAPHPITYYSQVDPLKFKDIIQKYSGVQDGV